MHYHICFIIMLPVSLLATCALCTLNPATVISNTCGDMHPRLEIRELATNIDQFTVLLLGLKRMKEVNSTNPISYYAIAGIHGFPYTGYDDVGRCARCSPDSGFCAHVSHIFAIWHRPYMALFERSLRINAMAAVKRLSNSPIKQRYLRAAQSLRLPYWDFAKAATPGNNVLPSIFTSTKVALEVPGGNITIDNPLYQFDFSGNMAPSWDILDQQKTTRHPLKSNSSISRQEEAIAAVQALQNPQGHDSRCGLYRLMYQETNINNFGGSAWVNGAINIPYDNIESIHDDIHIAVGGAGTNNGRNSTGHGTMWYIPAASFDPIFWMHHAMIDRMLAMWQVLHPDSWIETHNGTNTWTISSDMGVNGSTPLTPFFMDSNGTSWTGDTARFIASFCYSYSDVGPYATVEQISSVINNLYGQGCPVSPPPGVWPQLIAPHPQINNTNGETSRRSVDSSKVRSLSTLSQTINNLVTGDGAVRDYVANIQVDSMAVGESITVYIFDGRVNEDPGTWENSAYLIGRRTFLMKSMNAMSGQLRKGTVSMSNKLMSRVQDKRLSGFGNEEVIDYLTTNMNWKVVKACGKVVPNELVPGLVVSVVTADVQPASDQTKLPVWSNPRLLSAVTAGKPGGLNA